MFPLPPITVETQEEYDHIIGLFGGESGWSQWIAMVTAAEVRRLSIVQVDERLRAQRDEEVAGLTTPAVTAIPDVAAVELQTPVMMEEA